KSWVSQAHDSIAGQIAGENAGAFNVSPSVTISNDVAIITGTAPINIRSIFVNGGEYPLTWTSVTGFRVMVPLQPGSNQLRVVGVDMNNHAVPGASNLVSVVYNGAAPTVVGRVAINEI